MDNGCFSHRNLLALASYVVSRTFVTEFCKRSDISTPRTCETPKRRWSYPMQALAQTIEQRFPANGVPAFAQPAAPDALDLLEQFGSAVSVRRDREIHAQG